MKLFAATSCLTCRMIRRFLLSFGVGGVLAWQITGANPFQPGSGVPMNGLLIVAMIFAFLSVFMRMREMRARFRRRG